MSDKPYENLISCIKGLNSSHQTVYLGQMLSSNSCQINNLKLASDDLLFSEHLVTGYQGEDIYIKSLAKGDYVLVLKLNEEKYIIVERLVST